MSIYKRLDTESESGIYVQPFSVSRKIEHTENTTRVTPRDPVPKYIPSQFDPRAFENVPRADGIYGPTSKGHASLRYYGNGPY